MIDLESPQVSLRVIHADLITRILVYHAQAIEYTIGIIALLVHNILKEVARHVMLERFS